MTVEEMCEEVFAVANISENWSVSRISETENDYVFSVKPRGEMGTIMPIALSKRTGECRTFYMTKEASRILNNAKKIEIPERFKE